MGNCAVDSNAPGAAAPRPGRGDLGMVALLEMMAVVVLGVQVVVGLFVLYVSVRLGWDCGARDCRDPQTVD